MVGQLYRTVFADDFVDINDNLFHIEVDDYVICVEEGVEIRQCTSLCCIFYNVNQQIYFPWAETSLDGFWRKMKLIQ